MGQIMTSPAAIAQRLKPAQVRAMKASNASGNPITNADLQWAEYFPIMAARIVNFGVITPLGLAVLTELERMGK